MKTISEFFFLWTVGGCIYYGLELFFRGFSHWSMFVLGGICFLFCTLQSRLASHRESLLIQIWRCMIFVLCCEFITGIFFNCWMNLAVWDYSGVPGNLFGQICLPFALLFALLCTIGIYLGNFLLNVFFFEPPVRLHVLSRELPPLIAFSSTFPFF